MAVGKASTMSQPEWKFIANLGDVNPLAYGGLFVYIDETGVYPPEMERIEEDEDYDPDPEDEEEDASQDSDDEPRFYIVHRVVLDKCEPNHKEWFSDSLDSVCASMDYDRAELDADLCSDDPIRLANAYRAILDHHGWENMDQYPDRITHAEALERYTKGEIKHGSERDI